MDSDDGQLPSPPGPPKGPAPCLPPPLPARPRKTSPQPPIPVQEPSPFDLDQEVENDDEISQQMTASYSEISFKSGLSPENEISMFSLENNPLQEIRRPVTLPCDNKALGPLTLEGSVHKEGNMTHFVAEDLEYKIKLSNTQSKKGDTPPLSTGSRSCTPSSLYRQLLVPQISQIDMRRLLNDLECEAQKIATSIDSLTENLCGNVNTIDTELMDSFSQFSSITADNVDVYKNAVSKMSNAMDANIKSMYTMMAKAEEITQGMKSVQTHATRLKEIKRLVDLFESYV